MISEIIASCLLVSFVLGFAYLGVQFLRKKRKERIEIMTDVLEADPVSAPVPIPAQVPVPAQVLVPAVVEAPLKSRNLASALSPTRKSWVSRLSQVLSGRSDQHDRLIEEVEEVLFSADIGVKTSTKLLEIVKRSLSSAQDKPLEIRKKVSESILDILRNVQVSSIEKKDNLPCVIMFVGVNGVGKTTTIGKLASQFVGKGRSVVLGAGDTFRAAAAEQLEIWAKRSGSEIIRGQEGADPASVLFEAVNKARQNRADFVMCDTAGRLHTKVNLMEELKKVHRVLGKACEGAPHEVLLVVDATTGQNAIEQARQFKAATPLTGVILTKLDGTAKGGVVIGIADELGIPIRYIGVGEGASDLRPFDAEEFVKALFAEEQKELVDAN